MHARNARAPLSDPPSSLSMDSSRRPSPSQHLPLASFLSLQPCIFPCHGRPRTTAPPTPHGAPTQLHLPLRWDSSSSSTLLSSLAQPSPMARCSRRPGASPPWLATRLPPCLRAAAQCTVGACYVLDKMCSKPRVVDSLQQLRPLPCVVVELPYCSSPMETSSPSASHARLAALAHVVSQ
jgi:hypothetical protein